MELEQPEPADRQQLGEKTKDVVRPLCRHSLT